MQRGLHGHLPALHHDLPLKRRQLPAFLHPLLFAQPRVLQWREDGRDEKREQPAPFHFIQQVESGFAVVVGLAGLPIITSLRGTSCCG